ncbi:Pentatricopeptide repeat-containing protein, chloroplastic [Symbiodinium microadriaticum]|uniref:Pentatricopeptide repeat-containing protein, chloroplastic n=1 Tax=Symbiodinium microadriaticum TaxID=2951 RepID=A0A1Q9EFC1_SYMMI|nr:Pentatricopeptide repeat-containing protein, chloroplastic [Symbiodinium microadriaticum]
MVVGFLWDSLLDKELRPDAVTYHAAMMSFDKGTQWQRSLALLHSMSRNSVQRIPPSYNIVLNACQRAAEWQLALGLFASMSGVYLEVLQQLVPPADQLHPPQSTAQAHCVVQPESPRQI